MLMFVCYFLLMSEKLYYKDPYIKEFEATVTGCFVMADGRYRVSLDRTAFFPEEGGQTPDKGTLNGMPVVDVILEGDEVFHIVYNLLPEGTKVKGEIDWDHRFRNMQMHTGEHIFSGLVHEKFGFNNVGFHLSDNSATMDYDGKLSEEDVRILEDLANKVIREGHEIITFFPSKEEAESLDYRSKKDIADGLRLVKIEGVDLCACCAPHLKNTQEVGIIMVTSFENYKGGTRLNYLCGERAYKDYMRLVDLETALSRLLNSKKEDIYAAVEKLQGSVSELEFSNVALRRMRVSNICENCEKSIVFLTGDDADLLRFAVGELKSRFCGFCAAFSGDDEKGYRFLAECDGGDLTDLSEILKERFDMKGGGRNGLLQGSLSGSKSEIEVFLMNECQNLFEC